MATRRVGIGIMVVLLLAVAAWVVLSAGDSGGDDPGAHRSAPPHASTRGCAKRVESGEVYTPDLRHDVVVGPFSIGDLSVDYRDAAARVRRGTLGGVVPFKSVALVMAGERVTLAVPRDQRKWLRLAYAFPFNRRGVEAIRLAACRRFSSPSAQRAECRWAPRLACHSATTQFSGGVLLDFDRAPRLGRCAAINVWVDDESGPTRALIFDPPPGTCGDAG